MDVRVLTPSKSDLPDKMNLGSIHQNVYGGKEGEFINHRSIKIECIYVTSVTKIVKHNFKCQTNTEFRFQTFNIF